MRGSTYYFIEEEEEKITHAHTRTHTTGLEPLMQDENLWPGHRHARERTCSQGVCDGGGVDFMCAGPLKGPEAFIGTANTRGQEAAEPHDKS